VVGAAPPGGPGEPPPAGVPLVFVADLGDPELSSDDRHHLERVLRVGWGAPLAVGDGAGRWRPAVLGARLEVTGEVVEVAAPAPELVVGFALVKGQRPELVVQKLTELGVDRIVPFTAERSVVRWPADRQGRHAERLARVAREAAMQCRRAHLPVVEELASFEEVAGRPGAAGAERGGDPPDLSHPVVLVGPEGGWSPHERDRLVATVGLGPQVLRAETAAIVAGALLAALRAGVVGAAGGSS
jgi:16S rRNA (uracil1498-N3)-methyltransferase